jgi:hypothetical protein
MQRALLGCVTCLTLVFACRPQSSDAGLPHRAPLAEIRDLKGSAIRVSASLAPAADGAAGPARVLISVANSSGELLVLGTGGERHDWVKSYTLNSPDRSVGGGGSTVPATRDGDRICPAPEYVLLVPPGSGVSRLQELEMPELNHPESLTLTIHILVYPASLQCGAATVIEQTIKVSL